MAESSAKTNTQILIDLLGITPDINEAGYILPDARLLHLQRSNSFKRQNHLDVIKLLPCFKGQEHSIIDTDMMRVMAQEQLVRFCIDGKIHTAIAPTSAQLRKIYNTLTYRSDSFEIIVSNQAGMTLAQHQVSGPSMSTLVDIFSIYKQQTDLPLSEDEFSLSENDSHYLLIFRPSLKTVGKLSKKSKMLKVDSEYQNAANLFLRLVKAQS